MGPCYRTYSQHECQPPLQSLPSQSQQTGRARQVPRREPLKRTNLTIEVTHGFSVLLRQKEGWQATTRTRLLQAQQDDDQESLPTSSHL